MQQIKLVRLYIHNNDKTTERNVKEEDKVNTFLEKGWKLFSTEHIKDHYVLFTLVREVENGSPYRG